jgi:UDP-N-acetylglucosamine--N-acetylmuramyl-(pentapeptide) pyrophosphoryl-undecaprenol N-acetylglucosamine transferase
MGWDVAYLGSLRGIESKACQRAGVEFVGFPSEPLYRLWTPRGVRAALRLLKSQRMAASEMRAFQADVVFSTGGYSSAPVAAAARALRVPYVIHEQNTVPGRTNRILGQTAAAVCTVFESSRDFFPPGRTHVTGLPIRRELRASAQGSLPLTHSIQKAAPIVLVMGGSQGSEAINDIALATAVRMSSTPVQWLHITGAKLFERTIASKDKMAVRADYTVKAYLDAAEMASALFSCSLAVCRSGAGTLAELAAFRKPSILVPYPHAFGDHQRLNALEFERMGAAEVLPQAELRAANLESRILGWLRRPERIEAAERSLAAWDKPGAADDILGILEGAAQ